MGLGSAVIGSALPVTDFGNLNACVAQLATLYDLALSPAGPLTKMYDNLGSESGAVKRTVIYKVGNFPHFIEIGGASSTLTALYQRMYTMAMASAALPSAFTSATGVSAGYNSFTIGVTTLVPMKVLYSPNVLYIKANADGVSGTMWWFSAFSDGNWRGSSGLATFVHIDSDANGTVGGSYALANGKFADGGIPLLPMCLYTATSVFDYVPLNYFGYYYNTLFSFYQDTVGKYYFIQGTGSPYAVFLE